MNRDYTHVLAAGLTAAALAVTLLHAGVRAQETTTYPTAPQSAETPIPVGAPSDAVFGGMTTFSDGVVQAKPAAPMGPQGVVGRAPYNSVICATDITPGTQFGKRWCVQTKEYWPNGQPSST